MTTLPYEPSPPLGTILRSWVLACAGFYVFFTALMLEVYVLVPVAAACFLGAVLPARRLLKRR